MQERLNQLGRNRRPCFFILPYDAPFDEGFCYPLDALAPQLAVQMGPYRLGAQPLRAAAPPQLVPDRGDYEQYRHAFEALMHEIGEGNSYLANLCARTPLRGRPDLEQLYAWSQSRFKLLFRDRFVCFSPESFITIRANRLMTHPMKGTLPCDQPPEQLLKNPKEQAEHTMVVDLLRNDLSQIAKGVRVKRWRYIEQAGSLWQSSSAIAGQLDRGWPDRLGDLLATLLPAGSISGAPKRSTVAILDRIEGFRRGFFSGVFGIFDGQDLYSAVLIRFVEQASEGAYFKSGGGITADSDPQAEYAELRAKARFPLAAPLETAGVFETIRVQNGRAILLGWHRRRLQAAAARRGFRLPRELLGTLRLPRSGRFRLKLTIGPKTPAQYTLHDAAIRRAKRLRLVRCAIRYPLKCADRHALQALYKSRQNADDVVIVRNGLISDTTVANVAIFDGDRWLTPAAPLLKGTVRARLLAGGFLTVASLRPETLEPQWLVGLMNAMTGFYVAGQVKDVLIDD